MSFESQDGDSYIGEDDRKRDSSRKRDGKKEKKDKGYQVFEEEDSEEEQLVLAEEIKSPSKTKKDRLKPTFKFPVPVRKEKGKEKEEKKDKESKQEGKEKKKEEKKKHKKDKKKLKLGHQDAVVEICDIGENENPIFGVPLGVAVDRNKSHDGIELPAIVRECIDYIEECGLAREGIYRISGVKSKVQHLKDCYNRQQPVYLYEHEPNIVASLLKQFLRDLPEPVLTSALMPKFEEASTIKNNKKKVETFIKLISDLPTCNRLLLSWMIVHMTHVIELAKENKMTLQNVSIVLSPTMQISHRVLNVLFSNVSALFGDVLLRKYVPPLKPAHSKWTLELPDNPSALEEELAKQESLLNQLHAELNSGRKDPVIEEQLWEVQRVVTQLKRKIKMAKKNVEMGERRRTNADSKRLSTASIPSLSAPEDLHLDLRPAPKANIPETHTVVATVEVQSRDSDDRLSQGSHDSRKGVRFIEETPTPTAIVEAPGAETPVNEQAEGEKVTQEERTRESSKAETVTKIEKADTEEAASHPPLEASSVSQDKEGIQEIPNKEVENLATLELPDTGKIAVGASVRLDHETTQVDTGDREKTVATRQIESGPIEVIQHTKSVLPPEPKAELKQVDVETYKDAESHKGDDSHKGAESHKGADSHKGDDSHKDAESQKGGDVESHKIGNFESQKPAVVEPHISVGIESRVSADGVSQISAGVESRNNAGVESQRSVKFESGKSVPVESHRQEVTSSQHVEEIKPRVVNASVHKEAAEIKPKPARQVEYEYRKAPNPPFMSTDLLQPMKAEIPKPKQAEEHDETLLENLRKTEELRELEEELLGQKKSRAGNDGQDDVDTEQLLEEEYALKLEEEELIAIADELRQKIATERSEMERLNQEIQELQYLRQDSDLEDLSSSSSSSDDSEDEDDLQELVAQLIQENEELEMNNADLCQKIHEERMICLSVKLQIRLLQQKQLETSCG